MAVTRGLGEGMGNCNSRGAKLQLCKTSKSQRPSGLHCACSQECSTMHCDICQKARSHVMCSYRNKKKHINKYTISLIKGKEPHNNMDETQVNYVLSEGSQTQKLTCCMILLYNIPEKANLSGQSAAHWLPGAGGRKRGLTHVGHRNVL